MNEAFFIPEAFFKAENKVMYGRVAVEWNVVVYLHVLMYKLLNVLHRFNSNSTK